MAVETSHKDITLSCLIEEFLAPVSDVLVTLWVKNNLSTDEFVLFDESQRKVDVLWLKSTGNTDGLVGWNTGVEDLEDFCIFLSLEGVLSTDLSSIDNVESSLANLIESDLWVCSQLDGWDEKLFCFNFSGRNTTTLRDDVGLDSYISLVTSKSALWKFVNHEQLTTNCLVHKGGLDWLDHCLCKSCATFGGLKSHCNNGLSLLVGISFNH